MGNKTVRTTRRYPQTDAQRQQWNAYMRRYRKDHPDKTREWRDNYIIRRAARLAAEQATGGAGHGRN